ncbi:hypothetical protein JKP88DRAFT_304031 [Tribonema minus]|uniref:Uncharacterized protein n=1 Tax=Tribonema minus TaxID=303371 RepID=A0A835ZC54_9STRA|nr:hypothetical protein JKP88DRAFT_304031 [Tribonema minus]
MMIRITTDADIVEAATWAVSELRKLSDTGVYESLALKSIKAAATGAGVYHDNTFLTLVLASPHFDGGSAEEEFEVMVMQHKTDGHRNFAISEFPAMAAGAIEQFYMQKVDADRKLRDAALQELDREAELYERCEVDLGGDCTPAAVVAHMLQMTGDQLRQELALRDPLDPRAAAAQQILASGWRRAHFAALRDMTTAEVLVLYSDAATPAARRGAARAELERRMDMLDIT